MAALDDAIEHVAHGRAGRRGDDVDPRHHDLSDGLFAELDHAGDHLALVLFQVSIALNQVAQPVLGLGWGEPMLDAHEPPQPGVERVQRHEHEEEHAHKDLDRPDEGQRDALWSRNGNHAPDELDEQHNE